MCIIGDYRQIIAQREMGMPYSEIQAPKKDQQRITTQWRTKPSIWLHGHKSGDKEKTSQTVSEIVS